MLRRAEPGSNNLGRYLADVGEELAADLQVEAKKLASLIPLPDEEIAPLLQQLLEHRAAERTCAHQAQVREAALLAAQQIAATALWTNHVAALDVRLLLGPLLVDARCTYLLFDAHGPSGAFQVSLPRRRLVLVAKELARRGDLRAAIDAYGLHFQWNRGRGGLNLVSQSIPPTEAMNVLCVGLPIPRAMPRIVRGRRAQPDQWLAELLAEIALA